MIIGNNLRDDAGTEANPLEITLPGGGEDIYQKGQGPGSKQGLPWWGTLLLVIGGIAAGTTAGVVYVRSQHDQPKRKRSRERGSSRRGSSSFAYNA